ncbi:hypothetical protein GCM10023219_06080 [Stakelama sediminis]|uniref:Uncharacterized protein n=1 Tax=Stakelama sediminis TaxID=463200 RepID=A0A840YUX0_9SPHN|nr:hypothetical protein [Stakelama sediminis]MBB5717325.1 hypothetical protein [Stakelama sediminis]
MAKAKETVEETAEATVEETKKRPFKSAAIVTGALAAIGGSIFGLKKLRKRKKSAANEDTPVPPKVTPSAD